MVKNWAHIHHVRCSSDPESQPRTHPLVTSIHKMTASDGGCFLCWTGFGLQGWRELRFFHETVLRTRCCQQQQCSPSEIIGVRVAGPCGAERSGKTNEKNNRERGVQERDYFVTVDNPYFNNVKCVRHPGISRAFVIIYAGRRFESGSRQRHIMLSTLPS